MYRKSVASVKPKSNQTHQIVGVSSRCRALFRKVDLFLHLCGAKGSSTVLLYQYRLLCSCGATCYGRSVDSTDSRVSEFDLRCCLGGRASSVVAWFIFPALHGTRLRLPDGRVPKIYPLSAPKLAPAERPTAVWSYLVDAIQLDVEPIVQHAGPDGNRRRRERRQQHLCLVCKGAESPLEGFKCCRRTSCQC